MSATNVSNPISDRQVQSIVKIIKNTIDSDDSFNMACAMCAPDTPESLRRIYLGAIGAQTAKAVAGYLGLSGDDIGTPEPTAKETEYRTTIHSAHVSISNGYGQLDYMKEKLEIFGWTLYENMNKVEVDVAIWSDIALGVFHDLAKDINNIKDDLEHGLKVTDI